MTPKIWVFFHVFNLSHINQNVQTIVASLLIGKYHETCFPILRESLLAFNQLDIFDNSEFNSSSISLRLFPFLNMFVSSANNIEVVEEHTLARSCMCNRNDNCPNIDPLGTSHIILFTVDDIPLCVTYCLNNFDTNWDKSLLRQQYQRARKVHYSDVIMDSIASQITSLTIVYSTIYSDADQRKHQSSASLAFVRGIHRGPVNSPHKWPVTRKMFPFDDVIMSIHSKDKSHHFLNFICLSVGTIKAVWGELSFLKTNWFSNRMSTGKIWRKPINQLYITFI